jgi:Cytotoxic
MSQIPRPSPCYLDRMDKWRVINGVQVWRSLDRRRLYTWDGLHGEIEVFDQNGYHLGALNAVAGTLIKDAIQGRRLYLK